MTTYEGEFDSYNNEELQAEYRELLSDTKTYWSKEEVQRDWRRAQRAKAELQRRGRNENESV